MFNYLKDISEKEIEKFISENNYCLFIYDFQKLDNFKNSKILIDIINENKDIKIYILNKENNIFKEVTDNINNTYIYFKNSKFFELGILI